MKKIKFLILLVTVALAAAGCSDSDSAGPVIKATISADGQSSGTEIYVPAGSDVEYKFTVNSTVPLKTVEIHRRRGTGVNAQEPVLLERISLKDADSYSHEITGSLDAVGDDYQFSVYAEDLDGNFTSLRVCAWLDIMRYSQTMTDGRKDATSKTFINLESGTTYYIANTIADPAGIDMGFTYMENTAYQACLVSFDEYYKTGNYAMVVNDVAPWMEFRDATKPFSQGDSFDDVTSTSEIKAYFDNGVPYDRILDYSAGRIAHTIWENDVVAFRTKDGRYGLLRIDGIDRRDESELNNQTVDFSIIITKNR